MGERMGVSAYRRLGKKTAFRHGYDDKEVSPELMMLCKADPPTRPYVSPGWRPRRSD